MIVSECSYCGIQALTENGVCSTCSAFSTKNEQSVSAGDTDSGDLSSTENVNNRRKPHLGFTRAVCWKCGAVNNFKQTPVCLKCGCALRPYKEESENQTSYTNHDEPTIRPFMLIIPGFLLLFMGFFYFMGGATVKSPPVKASANASVNLEAVALPSNSWHKSSVWNFFRKTPTVEEILKKNEEVTSKLVKQNDIQTLSLSGKISFANGGCATDVCAKIEFEKAKREDDIRNKQFQMKSNREYDKEYFKVGLSEYIEDFDYREAGQMESRQKFPDKVFRKVSVAIENQSRIKEIVEGFDGVSGWRKEITRAGERIIDTTDKNLMDMQLFELKNSASALRNNYNPKSLSLIEIKNVKGQINFVLQTDNSDKKIYYDAVTGFVSKIEIKDGAIYFSKYEDYQGVQLPSLMHVRTIHESGNAVLMKVENIVWKINEPIEDSVFAKN